jgi:dihydroxyacetone kinase-like protein
MTDCMGRAEFVRMFVAAAGQIRQEHEVLSQLDCVGGDGDHGTTMLRAMAALEESLKTGSAKSLQRMLKEAGWSVLNVDGGASSALLGTLIAGMGDASMSEDCSCRQLAASLAAGLWAVEKQTKARRGDKTMMDALVPAVQVFEAEAARGATLADAMRAAAEAARRGAEGTKQMIAHYGRAKFLGEKTRGSPDAGATSMALLFRGFSTALGERESGDGR